VDASLRLTLHPDCTGKSQTRIYRPRLPTPEQKCTLVPVGRVTLEEAASTEQNLAVPALFQDSNVAANELFRLHDDEVGPNEQWTSRLHAALRVTPLQHGIHRLEVRDVHRKDRKLTRKEARRSDARNGGGGLVGLGVKAEGGGKGDAVAVADMVAMADVGAGAEEGAADDVAVVDVENSVFYVLFMFYLIYMSLHISLFYIDLFGRVHTNVKVPRTEYTLPKISIPFQLSINVVGLAM